jgi:hypothetical protein
MRLHPDVTDPKEISDGAGAFSARQMLINKIDMTRLPRPITAYCRYVNRRRCPIVTERSLAPSILPPGPVHIDAVFSVASHDTTLLTAFAGANASVVVDFLIKAIGKADARHDVVSTIPVVGIDRASLLARSLRLNCLTRAYADLWAEVARESIRTERWTTDDSRLCHEFEHVWADLNPDKWDWKTPLRSDFARRQALLEIDVLVAQSLGLTLDELLDIYRIQFPVMRQYERVDEYDARGRRIPNTARKDDGGTEFRDAWPQRQEAITSGRVLPDAPFKVSWPIDNGLQTVTKTFYPPFTNVDREEDYRRAWAVFGSQVKSQEKGLTDD